MSMLVLKYRTSKGALEHNLNKLQELLATSTENITKNEKQDLERFFLLNYYYARNYLNDGSMNPRSGSRGKTSLELIKDSIAEIAKWSCQGFFQAERFLRLVHLFQSLGGGRVFIITAQFHELIFHRFKNKIGDWFWPRVEAMTAMVSKLAYSFLRRARRYGAPRHFRFTFEVHE